MIRCSRALSDALPLKASHIAPSSSSTAGGIVMRRLSLGAFAFVFAAGGLRAVVLVVFATSGPRVTLLVCLEQPPSGHVRVALRGRNSRVSQQFLHSSDVGPSFEEMRGERMPKGMRSDPPPREQTPRILFHHRTDVAPGEGLPPAVEEHGRPVLTR